MSSVDDNPDQHEALLPLELNPLTSPLLSKNMGRWAEVYFTSPPEKREQAIQDLLRELAGDTAAAGNPDSGADLTGEHLGGEPASNGGGHAAASIAASGPVPWSEIVAAANGAQEAAPGPASHTDRLLAPMEPSPEGALGWLRSDQRIEADPPRLFLDHPSTHRRNRVLTTAALAILVGTLFYVSWRETAGWLRIHDVPRSAAPETRPPTERLPQPAGAVTGTSGVGGTAGGAAGVDRSASSTKDGSSSHKPDTGANPAPGVPSAAPGSPIKDLPPRTLADGKTNQARASEAKSSGASPNRVPPNQVPATQVPATQVPANQVPANQVPANQTTASETVRNPGPGAEELAEAESYLNGTQGKPRDGSEAAKWLWKSVAKQNAVAAMLLSDLYVRGEGVAKNCDQARLLLDAAAQKGIPGAGQRIRNLPGAGCP